MSKLLRDYVICPAPTHPVLHLRSPRFEDETWCGKSISVKEPSDEQLDWELCRLCHERESRGR